MKYFCPFLLSALFVALFFRIGNFVKAIRSEGWLSVQGKVLSSQVRRIKLRSPRYLPKVKYEYSIGGGSYSSERFSFSPFLLFYRAAQRVVEQYPPGKSVTVYYNPNNPREAVLIQGHAIKAFILLLLALILTAYFLWVVLSHEYLSEFAHR